jgi:tetratricopeptide (TPR) repeat protein
MVKHRSKSSAQQASSRRAAQKAKKLRKAERKKQSVPSLLDAASTAMARLDVETAYQSYSQAAVQLQQQQQQSVAVQIASETPQPDSLSSSFCSLELVTILEKMGEIQVSMGDPDQARAHFEQALQILEAHGKEETFATTWQFLETHASLCLYIGQVSMEQEALKAYLKGVASLEKSLKLVLATGKAGVNEADIVTGDDDDETMDGDESNHPRQQEENLQQLRQKLSGAYCTIADLYLTDLCEEETAETDCNDCLEKALQLNDSEGEPFVDALQTMANLRLSQQDKQHEAVPLVLRAYEKHRIGYEALAALVGLGQDEGKGSAKMDEDDEEPANELVEVEAANNLPEFEFRCQTAKILLECADICKKKTNDMIQAAKCIDAAISVLGSLLAQNDEVVEIWYLTGCAFAAKTPAVVDAAQFYLDHAKEMLIEVRKNLQQELEFADDESERCYLEEEIETNAAQMGDIASKLEELGLVGGAKDDDPDMQDD